MPVLSDFSALDVVFLSDRELNKLAYQRACGYYSAVRDALCARQPNLDKKEIRRRAYEAARCSYKEVRDMLRRGEDGVPSSITAVIHGEGIGTL